MGERSAGARRPARSVESTRDVCSGATPPGAAGRAARVPVRRATPRGALLDPYLSYNRIPCSFNRNGARAECRERRAPTGRELAKSDVGSRSASRRSVHVWGLAVAPLASRFRIRNTGRCHASQRRHRATSALAHQIAQPQHEAQRTDRHHAAAQPRLPPARECAQTLQHRERRRSE